jgi:hypothetical protein
VGWQNASDDPMNVSSEQAFARFAANRRIFDGSGPVPPVGRAQARFSGHAGPGRGVRNQKARLKVPERSSRTAGKVRARC